MTSFTLHGLSSHPDNAAAPPQWKGKPQMANATDSVPNPRANAASGVRTWLGNRRRLLLIAGAMVLALGLIFQRSWLVAAGVPPLLFSALPCLAMCALGLCMGKMGNSSAPARGASTELGSDAVSDAAASSRLVTPDGSAPIDATAPVVNAKPGLGAGKSCCH